MIIYLLIVLRTKNVSDKICRENQNTHFMFNNVFPVHRAVYEIMCVNAVQPDRPRMAISYNTENMQFECAIPKAKIQTQNS